MTTGILALATAFLGAGAATAHPAAQHPGQGPGDQYGHHHGDHHGHHYGHHHGHHHGHRRAVLAFSPAPFDFGNVTSGQTAQQDLTLTNTGDRGTGRLWVRLSGSDAFTVTDDTCRGARLRPDATCTVTVRFAPTAEGAQQARLTAVAGGRHQHGRSVRATDVLTGTGGGLGGAPGHLYWSTESDAGAGSDAIWMAGLDGSGPQQIATAQGDPAGVAVDATHLYWTSQDNNSIVRANLDGSDPQTIVSDQDAPFGLAISNGHLYWSNFGDDETIWMSGLDGSDAHQIVSGQFNPTGVAADSSHLYWVTRAAPGGVFGSVWQAGLDGSNPRAIAGNLELPFGLAVDAEHLYYADLNQETVFQANLDGSNAHAIATNLPLPSGVAVADQLYWTTFGPAGSQGNGSIVAANLNGTGAHTIVSGQADPVMVAVTPTAPAGG